jgi:hypothetical protein
MATLRTKIREDTDDDSAQRRPGGMQCRRINIVRCWDCRSRQLVQMG